MGFKHNDAEVANDEPIFVLRAKDKTAPATVRHWIYKQIPLRDDEAITIYDQRITDNPKLAEARELADRMDDWQRAHPDLVKMPD